MLGGAGARLRSDRARARQRGEREPGSTSVVATRPCGRLGNQSTRTVPGAAGALEPVSRSLVVFRIGEDGKLSYLHKYDVSEGDVLWVKAFALPQ